MMKLQGQGDISQNSICERLKANRSFSLRMAPMIDIIFLLLLFFLVAAKWRPSEDFLPVKLPTAHGQALNPGRAEPLAIYISATPSGCAINIGQYTIPLKNENIEAGLTVLLEKMKDCLVSQKRFVSDPVEIICGPDVRWEYLAKIYNVFFGAGLTDITFQMTEQTGQETKIQGSNL